MNEKSEAQLKNEEAVRKIMAERGYDRTPKKKKRDKKLPKVLLVLPGILILCLVSIAIVYAIINKNNNYSSKTQNTNNYSPDRAESIKDANEPTDAQILEGADDNNSYSNDSSNNYYSQSSTPDSTYESGNEAQPSQQYDDRAPFDSHHCDAVQTKYNAAYDEIGRLQEAYNTAYNNQTPYNELYKRANKNASLATKWMEEEQQAVSDAMRALKEAQATASSIYWDEVVPCEKEMYGLK